jgi:uncharacterized protein
MQKRVFIVHGWASHPGDGWFPWLKAELEKHGFAVFVPAMPDPDVPKIETWIPALAAAVGTADADTYFVGHSIGCQTIIRYLQTLPEGARVGGGVFVAGFYNLRRLETKRDLEIAKPWVTTPLDDAKIRQTVRRAVAIFSDNDKFVMSGNQDAWRDRVGADVIIEHAKGHFSGEDGVTELPIALESLLKISL